MHYNALEIRNKQIKNLEKENQELKEKIKSLRVERDEMAKSVSADLMFELTEMSIGAKHFDDLQDKLHKIAEFVQNKILEYMSESKTEKKFRKMTYKELSEWLAKGNGQFKDGNFGSFRTELVYCKNEENTIVDNNCLIRGFNETEWHEPLIEESRFFS